MTFDDVQLLTSGADLWAVLRDAVANDVRAPDQALPSQVAAVADFSAAVEYAVDREEVRERGEPAEVQAAATCEAVLAALHAEGLVLYGKTVPLGAYRHVFRPEAVEDLRCALLVIRTDVSVLS